MFAKRVEVDYSLLDEDITIEELAQYIVDNDENTEVINSNNEEETIIYIYRYVQLFIFLISYYF